MPMSEEVISQILGSDDVESIVLWAEIVIHFRRSYSVVRVVR